MITVHINPLMTLAIAVFVLLVGMYLQKRIAILEKFYIPAPVIGGLLFSMITAVMVYFQWVNIQFESGAQGIFMVAFFATVGFSASIRFLIQGGRMVVLLFLCIALLVVLQNLLGISIAKLLGMTVPFGIANGSVTLVGGHGTGIAFSGILADNYGLLNATTLTAAAATFGLISGSLMGGPVARYLVRKYDLKPPQDVFHRPSEKTDKKPQLKISESGIFNAAIMIIIAIGIGSLFSAWVKSRGIVLPDYIGAMLVAAILRNVSEYTGWYPVKQNEITVLGGISLSLFLAIALMQMKLLSLVSMALPMLVILICQVIMMVLYARFVIFNVLGRNYDAAVMTCGSIGMGLGATPNAVANMEAFTRQNFPSPQAFFVVPIVGSFLIDFVNSGTITLFLNMF